MVLLLAAVYFFMKPARYAILLWGPKYLNERLGTSVTQSGAMGALFELAGPVSVLAAGVLSDKLFRSRRIPISVLCLVGMSALLFAIDKLPVSKMWFGTCLFLMGLLIFAPDSLSAALPPSISERRKARPQHPDSSTAAAPSARFSVELSLGFSKKSGAGTVYLPCWQSRF
jgi:sugar phosphate permease